MRKTVDFLDGVLNRAMMFVFVIMMMIGVYGLADSFSLYYHAQDRGILAFKPQKDTPVETMPFQGYVAWLTVDDTNIDYPVMQGEDNSEFLNKDPYGRYSLSGSIFLDFRNSPDFTDDYSLIYGHHMEHGAMFGALDEFMEESFFDSHKTGSLIVGNEEYELYIFAAIMTNGKETTIFNPTMNADVMGYVKQNKMYFREPKDGKILALSTCASANDIDRFVVFANIIGID